MKKHKSRHRKHLFLFSGIIVLFTILFTGFFFLTRYRSDLIYRMQKELASLCAKNPLSPAQTQTETIPLEELLSDPRCTTDQSLLLINTAYPLSADFIPDISYYKDSDVQMNTCMHEAYAALSAEVMERFGEHLYVRDAYRSAEEQAQKKEEKGETAAKVGSSEHQAGLALDVYVPQFAGMAFIKSQAGRYVDDHCQEYGFIVRYPSYGTKETGIEYEPWHLRYVGIPHAQIISEGYLTLEEYMELLKPGQLYQYDNYLISRQSGDCITVPVDFDSVTVSKDNMGGYLFTYWIN